MKSLSCAGLLFCLISAAAAGADRQSLVVRAGDEVRFAVQYGEGWSKPFLYPVLRPGWSRESPEAGAFVALRTADVVDSPGGKTVGSIGATARVAIVEMTGEGESAFARVPDAGGWVAMADVVPLDALAVRELAESPLPYDRKNPAVYDHPHHKGVWIGVDSVEGRNWWFETDRVRTRSVEATEDGFVWENEWTGGDDVLLRERTRWTVTEVGPVRVDISLTNARDEAVTFGDTKEGLLAVRVPDDFREKAGGQLVHADGSTGESAVWGREAGWMTYTGDSRGSAFGVTLIDHPTNFRASRYHARGYGLFSINPFGPGAYSKGEVDASPVTLKPGESLDLTYGLWFHEPRSPSSIAEAAKKFRGE